MMYKEMSDDELIKELKKSTERSENLGQEYNDTDPYSYTNIGDGYMVNTKEMLNEQIFDEYVAMGAILKELTSREVDPSLY